MTTSHNLSGGRLLALLASIGLFTGCVDPDDGPSLGTTEESIFAQVPGAHQVDQNLSWDAVASGVTGRYALASSTVTGGVFPENVVHAIYRDANGCLRRRHMSDRDGIWRTDTALQSCDSAGFFSDAGAVSWAAGRLDVFWFSFSLFGPARLSHAFLDGGIWRYEDLGATETVPTFAPAVASWGVGHLDVMWRDSTGALRWRSFDRAKKGAAGYTGSGWSIGEKVLLQFLPSSQISIVSPRLLEIHVAYRNGVSKLQHYYTTDGYNWTMEPTDVVIDTPPSLASWGPGHLVAYATRAGALRQAQKIGTTWDSSDYVSTTAIGTPVAAAALGRTGRIDLLGSPDGAALKHTFFQESLPGFRTLRNPYTKHWCWLNTTAMVVNYIHQMSWPTCQYASLELDRACCSATPEDGCVTTGSTTDALSNWGLDWDDDLVLTADQLRYQLQVRRMPVISHHDIHGSSTNHVVVLHDIYAVNGEDYVVIADPADGGKSWVWKYSTYLAYNTKWHVDYMLYNIHLD